MKHKKRPAQAPANEVTSKSQLKREAKALFALGKELSELPDPVLKALPLPRDILDDILFARSIKSNVARKRQLGFVAKRMRNIDLEPVQEALEARQGSARELNARHHRAEAWRDHLLANGDEGLGALFEDRHDVDTQALRQLVRNAQREVKHNKPPSTSRKLFRMLRELDEATPLPPLT